MTEAFIKTYVRKTLHDIKENPRRSTRNLVDFALNFANGRFQKAFLEAAQKLLCCSSSAYYDLIQDTVRHAEEEKILTFGMNIGYASCTLGAGTIRHIEEEQHFNVPWSLTLITDLEKDPLALSSYRQVLKQGKALGIYTWLLFAGNHPRELLPLVKENPDCAFILFCQGEDITQELITEAEPIHNLMFSIAFDRAAATACNVLRRSRFLYSLHFSYRKEDAGMVTSGGLLSCAETCHPIFTFLLPEADCPEEIQQVIYTYIQDARNGQKYATIPVDLIYDNRYIDSIISNEPCTAAFDSGGALLTSGRRMTDQDYNLFCRRLLEIFRQAYPKTA